MRDPQHQLEIYHNLNVLMEDQDEDSFKQEVDIFIKGGSPLRQRSSSTSETLTPHKLVK